MSDTRAEAPDALRAQLIALLGPDVVDVTEEALVAHARDLSAISLVEARSRTPAGMPLCVVRPRVTSQVVDALRWANEARVPVVPFGGGSGVVGAIVADGAVVVDMRSMSAVLDIDDKSRLVRVEAGINGDELAADLKEAGFTLGHEPQSVSISTVGGWIATRAVGQLSARYGGIEDLLAGLQAVLPTGRVATESAQPRRSTGPDVASLMIGSEGTLGIVTEATLRISPIITERADAALGFEHMADGVAVCRTLAQSELRPTLVRLYDREDVMIAFRSAPEPPIDPVLLLSFDGNGCEERADAAVAMSSGTPLSDDLVAHFWERRNDAVTDYLRLMAGKGVLGPHALVDTMEVAGTWSVLRDLYHDLKTALATETQVVGCHVSHVYPDGACLYFTMIGSYEDDASAIAAHQRWWDVGMRTCIAAGGAISHHHSIGRLKAPWLPEASGGWWEVLADIKKVLDPNGIMNPGALGL